MPRRFLAAAGLLICSAVTSLAGGPAFIAGSLYDPGVEGQPLVWANGSVQYFTDEGDLSPTLPNAQADVFVATAFSAWTGIAGVALTAAQVGHLAEDVNGGNIAADATGTITAPVDITSSATGTAVGIVYDYDGTVTDALLGMGAGGLADCFTNAVYGGPDNFTTGGNRAHAIVVINGICAASSSQLPDVQYRLVRVLGRILGLGWSQANLNVLTRTPPPTSDDFEGFPVMHFIDPISCVPITRLLSRRRCPQIGRLKLTCPVLSRHCEPASGGQNLRQRVLHRCIRECGAAHAGRQRGSPVDRWIGPALAAVCCVFRCFLVH